MVDRVEALLIIQRVESLQATASSHEKDTNAEHQPTIQH